MFAQPRMFLSKILENLKPRLRSLRLRVIGLLILALLPAFALMFFTASESRNRVIEETQENAVRLTRLAASNQDQLIDAARDILITLAQVPAIQSQDRPACLFFLSNVLMQHPLYANFGAANQAGEIFCMTLPQRQPYNIFNEDYFQQSITNQGFAISEYHISDINSEAMITLAYPVLSPTGEHQGIVFANLDLRWLGSFMNAATLPEDSRLRVIDRNGIILASYPKGDIEIGQKMPEDTITSLILNEKTGLTQKFDENGTERLFSYTALKAGGNTDIYVIISIPVEAALAQSNLVLKRNLLALLLGASLALITAWFGTNFFFLHQVNKLVDVTQQLSTGDLSARTKWQYGQGELDKLAMAFDDMAATLQRREQEQKLDQIQIQYQKERAEALARITERLNTTLDLDSVLQAVCDETCLAMNAPAAGVVVYQHAKRNIYHLGGPEMNGIRQNSVHPLPTSRLKSSASHLDEHYLMVDLHTNPELFPHEIRSSLTSRYLICVNLIHEGKLIGRLDLFQNEDIFNNREDLTFLKGIANSSVLAISNAQLYTALKLEERIRADLLHKVIGAQEDERMRISRELHDETSQSLTALLLGLDTIGIASNNDIDGIETHIQNLKMITEEMLDNIHRLIADLRPSLLDDLGLVPAIEWYGEQRLKQQGLNFKLEENIHEERFPRPVETVLFRVVQEGLTNALRHASASSIKICLVKNQDLVTLEIHDDGIGFDPQKLETMEPGGRGLGLLGMRERAAILGGTLQVESAIGKGTIVRILFHSLESDKNNADSNPAG
jgi:signal transduction histidine kinase/HAMP domain-containing protein